MVLQAARFTMNDNLRAAATTQLDRFTYGLANYERDEVARLVDAGLAIELHRCPS